MALLSRFPWTHFKLPLNALKESGLPSKTPRQLLEANARWSEERVAVDADYFRRLVALQTPEFLWIGCSDSRVPANVITGLEPGEVFVHRNVANLVYPADLNCMTVLQYAVETLQVKHIIVCGHYGCGGVRAVLEGTQRSLAEHWLAPVQELYRRHHEELSHLPNNEARIDRVCELNVIAQVKSLCDSPIVKKAWQRSRLPSVHGWIYRLTDGRLCDLQCPPSD
ncbi:MAG: carbonic anhydrase [Proteobacteria bacterium]|nr:MAG: carbonic anhydrase [Pseudomonadota bacterium]